jgi:hypothetical protein
MPSLVDVDALSAADAGDRTETAVAAVNAQPDDAAKKDAVAAVANTLSADQKLELAKELAASQWPKGDTAKAAIYITGFVVAGVVLVLCGLIAWKAQADTGSISSDLIVAASGLVSLLIGGLVGAYVQK